MEFAGYLVIGLAVLHFLDLQMRQAKWASDGITRSNRNVVFVEPHPASLTKIAKKLLS
jgi:hypothetical protein